MPKALDGADEVLPTAAAPWLPSRPADMLEAIASGTPELPAQKLLSHLQTVEKTMSEPLTQHR